MRLSIPEEGRTEIAHMPSFCAANSSMNDFFAIEHRGNVRIESRFSSSVFSDDRRTRKHIFRLPSAMFCYNYVDMMYCY